MAMGKAPAVPSRKKTRAPARPGLAKQVGIVLGGGTLLAAAVGTYLVFTSAGASPSPETTSAQASAAAPVPVDHSGSIVIKSGAGCRRMKFDNATGSITDQGPAACPQDSPGGSAASSGDSSAAAAERYGLIANGFKR
jgi:hypothetical protein